MRRFEVTGYKVVSREEARAKTKEEVKFRGLILKSVPLSEYVLGWNTWEVWIRVNEFKEVPLGRIYQTFRYFIDGDRGIRREGEGTWFVLGYSDPLKNREEAIKACYEIWIDRKKGKEERW